MRQHQRIIPKRYNTEQAISSKKAYLQQESEQFLQESSSEQKLSIHSIGHQNNMIFDFVNCNSQIRSRYVTNYNQSESSQNTDLLLTHRVQNLMKGLKQLIKELCLTKNATEQIEEELEKIIINFCQSIRTVKPNRNPAAYSLLSNVTEIRALSTYEVIDNSSNTIYENQIPGTQFLSKFLEGTSHQGDNCQTKFKINSYQQDLVQQFMERFLFLLQKQINRISRYNGQKKLKYLLETVMKQIFVHLMRFSYEMKLEIFKKQNKSHLNFPSNKAKVFASTSNRILREKQLISFAFHSIKSSSIVQTKADSCLVDRFETKINFLDNLIKVKQRREIREKFLEWKKNSILLRQLQKQILLKGVSQMVKEVLFQFALHEQNLEKWKFIVLSKLNSLIKSLCKFGQSILFPVDDELLEQNQQVEQRSFQTTRQHSRFKTYRESDSFRYSPSSTGENDENFSNQQKILDQIQQIFTNEEIKTCLKQGEIIMKQKNTSKIILIPIKAVSGIISVKIAIDSCSNSLNQVNPINISGFYNILTALQLSTPLILEMIHLKQKFEYFSEKIKAKDYHKFILKTMLNLQNKEIRQNCLETEENSNKLNFKKHSIFSEILSLTYREGHLDKENSFDDEINFISAIFQKMNVRKLVVYHKLNESYQCCLDYDAGKHEFQSSNIIGIQIIGAIMTELQKLNTNLDEPLKFLKVKKSAQSFYACPILKKNRLVGFIQVHLTQRFRECKEFSFSKQSQNSYIVTTLDSRNQSLNEIILLISQAILPLLMEFNHKKIDHVDLSKNISLKCEQCKLQLKNQEDQLKKSENALCSIKGILQSDITKSNELFLVYSKSPQRKLEQIEKRFYFMVNRALQGFNERRNVKQIQKNQDLLEPYFFTKIFYLETPRTKDGRLFNVHGNQTAHQKEMNFFSYDISSDKGLNAQLKLHFVDILQLFDTKLEKKPQQIQVPLGQLIEISKQMLRKEKSQINLKSNQTCRQNDYHKFLQMLLKSIIMKENNFTLESNKKYHSLELWLYQLQHLSKTNSSRKNSFCVTILPVFSVLSDKKKYLTGLTCAGGFSQINLNQQNNEQSFACSQYHSFTESVKKLSRSVLGRIFQIQIKLNQLQNTKKIHKNSINSFPIRKILKEQNCPVLKLPTLRQFPQAQKKQIIFYRRNISQCYQIISSINFIQNLSSFMKKLKIKIQVIPQFRLNLRNQRLISFKKMTQVIDSKILNTSSVARSSIWLEFERKLKAYVNQKSYYYMIKCTQFDLKMTSVFVRNKMLKQAFSQLKILPLIQQNMNHSFSRLKFVKKCATQRIVNILSQSLFNLSKNNSLYYGVQKILSFSSDCKKIQKISKETSIFKLQKCLKRIICQKSYIYYFQHLQSLQKSLYQSISLIGTEIQTIDFNYIYQFLKFISERITIIIRSQRKLISVLYGSLIQKINLQIIVQNLEDKSFFSLSLFDNESEKLFYSKTQHSIFNVFSQKVEQKSSNLIKILQNSLNNFYLSFNFVDKDLEQTKNQNKSFNRFQNIIRKVFQQNVSPAFNKFFTLYSKKTKAFTMKVSKALRTQTHFSQKNQSTSPVQLQMMTKKIVFDKLHREFIKVCRIVKVNEVSKEVQRKSKELEQLQSLYDKRAKKLMSQQMLQKDADGASTDLQEKIITKGTIKAIKQNIQNLDFNSQSLSIQYQIKSKTVASHQMIEAIHQMERKSALKQVALNLAVSPKESQLCDSKLSSQDCFNFTLNKDVIFEDMLRQQKQKLCYLKAQHQEENNFYTERFKKTSARSIAKVLKKLNSSTLKKIFYKINSFSCLNSPKPIR